MQKLTVRAKPAPPNGTGKPAPKRALTRLRARRGKGGRSIGTPAGHPGTPGSLG
jgi:hypothetical protein